MLLLTGVCILLMLYKKSSLNTSFQYHNEANHNQWIWVLLWSPLQGWTTLSIVCASLHLSSDIRKLSNALNKNTWLSSFCFLALKVFILLSACTNPSPRASLCRSKNILLATQFITGNNEYLLKVQKKIAWQARIFIRWGPLEAYTETAAMRSQQFLLIKVVIN